MKNIKTFSFKGVLLISSLISLVSIVIFSLRQHNVPKALEQYFTTLIIFLITIAGSVLVKRIITTLWGSLRNGLALHYFFASLFFLCVSLFVSDTYTPALIVIFILPAIILYSLDDRLFSFTKEPLYLKKFITGAVSKAPVFFKGLKGFAKKILENIKPALLKGRIFISSLKEKKQAKPVLISLGAVLAAAVLCWVIVLFFSARVVTCTPTGEVSRRTTITVTLSEEIKLKGDITEQVQGDKKSGAGNKGIQDLLHVKQGVNLFRIEPALSGSYRLEDRKTIVFVPDQELRPATEYSVKLNKEHILSDKPFLIGKSFGFSTAPFKITGTNLFYNYDFIKNIEKEIICEVNFNYPVDINELVKYASMEIDGDPLKVSIEPSNIPTRYYLRAGDIARKDTEASIKVTIESGLPCINGTDPLQSGYENKITMPETTKLAVVSAEAFPVESNTFIAILFNRPVSDSMVSKYVTIKSPEGKGFPYTVETEYCYAVLQADFKPNVSYTVSVAAGMRSKTGEELKDKFSYDVVIKDMEPAVKFSARGSVLPLRGNLDIELYSLNLDRFDVKIEKVYRNNLVYFLRNSSSSEFGMTQLYKTYDVVKGELNQKVRHYINLKKFHDMEYRGLFNIRVSDTGDYWNYDQQYVLCTDLGIMAKTSGEDLLVKVYSITGLTPEGGVSLKIISENNQVIQEGTTSGEGTFVFRNWKLSKENFMPYVITAERGDDYSFLQFAMSQVDTSRFAIGGEGETGRGLRAFMTSERGLYRPGETVYITAIVRNEDLTAPPAINVNLTVSDTNGERLAEIKKTVPDHGMLSFSVPVPQYARTGEYSAELRIDNKILLGSTAFKVEEFLPDKIKAEIRAPEKSPAPGKPLEFTVKGTQLFGPPAAKRKIKTVIRLTSRTFSHPSFEGYTFLDNEKPYSDEVIDLGERVLDDRGESAYTIDLPAAISPPSALTARVYTEIFDSGGRPVSAVKNIPLDYYTVYLGLRVDPRTLYIKDEPVSLSYIAIDPAGRYQKLNDARILVKHRVSYTIMKRKGLFDKKYESDTYEEMVVQKDVSFNGSGTFRFTPVAPGEYIIYFYRDKGMKTSQRIQVQGPGMVSTNMESAENLVISLNKNKYAMGETAVVNVISPIPGRVFFSVERDRVLVEDNRMLVNNRASFSFTVGPEHLPNTYVSAFVVRLPSESMKHLPMTSMGIKIVDVDPGERNMPLAITCPNEIRSSQGLALSCAAAPGSRMVLAAVDEGILQISQFKTPDPFSFFYMKQAMKTILYSIFDAILPDIKAKSLAIGGDEGEYDLSRRHINPIQARRSLSVSLYSGILVTDPGGMVRHTFKIPDFNGRLRVMALASSGKSFGSAASYVTVADPIVISPSCPRVLAPEDVFEIPVQVYNKTGKNAEFTITADVKGPLGIRGKKSFVLYIPDRSEKLVYVNIKAGKDAGRAEVIFTAAGAGETSVSRVELAVRPAQSLTTVTKSGVLKPGETAVMDVPSGFIKEGQRLRISLSPKFITQYLSALDYLLNYPYGCSEQIASQIFPLIYYRDLAVLSGNFSGQAGEAERFITGGLENIEKMSLSDGQFAQWPGETTPSPYISDYIAHLFLEADRHGIEVSDSMMKKIRNALGIDQTVSRARLDRRGRNTFDENNMYKLYLKALAGKPDLETMHYIKNNKLDSLNYIDQCRLASAFALIGDRESAVKILPSKFRLKYFPGKTGGDFDSAVKRLSVYLMALCDVDPESGKKYDVAREIASLSKNGHFGTTHDNVLALIALARAYEKEDPAQVKARVTLGGTVIRDIDGNNAVLSLTQASGKKLAITNKGDKSVYFWAMAEGTKLSDDGPEISRGFSISRKYYDAAGSELNLSSVEQGQLVVATIHVTPDSEAIDNLVIVDLVPAGFEVENIRIKSQGKLDFEPEQNWTGVYEDIRDDRIILFPGTVSGEMSFSYTLRAVSAGKFIIPRIYGEAMYNPDIRARGKQPGYVNVSRSGN